MIAHQTLASLWPTVPLLAPAGFVLGMAYFASLRRVVQLAVARRAWSSYVLSGMVRIGAAALLFAFAARWGMAALLAAFAGFLTARHLAVRGARRLA